MGVAWNHIKAQENFEDLCAKLKRVNLPGLFIHGEKDRLIPLDAGRKAAQCLPKSEFHVIPKMGHMFFSRDIENKLLTRLEKHMH